MFVFLSKLLPLFVYPVGAASILLILTLIFKKQTWKKFLVILALCILVLCGNRWITTSIVKSLEWRYLPTDNIPEAEAIVVLGGGTDAPDYPRPMVDVTAAGDRIIYGGFLYKQGKAPYVLLSGGNISWMGDRSNTPAEQMADILLLMDIPEDALILQTKSQNTYEDALYSCEKLKEMDIHRILLVTSALHMPRSVMLFEKQGIEVIPAPTDFRVTQTVLDDMAHPDFESFIINLIPNVSNISAFSNAIKEYIGMLVYHLRGWI